jgi:rhamnosyltransferase
MNKNVLACITAYYPGSEFENVCRIISQQTRLLLIIDNSIEGNLDDQGIRFTDNTVIICNKNKNTISGALNIALQYARDNSFEFLHIFDQDTVPPADITQSLVQAFKTEPLAAIISPRFINSSTNFPGRVLASVSKWKVKSIWPKTNVGKIKVMFAISSASLIRMSRVPEDLFYDTRLVIDGCDIDFCLCLRNAGFDILIDTSAVVYHGIGARKKGGGRWSATNYSPLRKQLSAKNRMMIWRRYWGFYPGYVLNDFYVFLLDSARTLLLEKNRFGKLVALCKGIWQGMREKNITERIGLRPDIIKINQHFTEKI